MHCGRNSSFQLLFFFARQWRWRKALRRQQLRIRQPILLGAEANLAGNRPASKNLWRKKFGQSGGTPVRRLRASAPALPSHPSKSGSRCRRSAKRPYRSGRLWSPPISERLSWRASRRAAEIIRVKGARTKDSEAAALRPRVTDHDRTALPMESRALEPAMLRSRTNPLRRIDGYAGAFSAHSRTLKSRTAVSGRVRFAGYERWRTSAAMPRASLADGRRGGNWSAPTGGRCSTVPITGASSMPSAYAIEAKRCWLHIRSIMRCCRPLSTA